MKAIIKVNKSSQKVLLDTELLGQFSDGFWENSRNQSWKYLGNVEITDGETGVYFDKYIPIQYKGYSVNNAELLLYVGDRMLSKARVANALNISVINSGMETILETMSITHKVENNIEIVVDDIDNIIIKLLSQDKFWQDRAKNAIDGINLIGGTQRFVEALNDTTYNIKTMRKDLREITKILKNTYNYNSN